MKTVACIGAGYVGGTTMSVMAYKCPSYRFVVVDVDAEKIRRWNSDTLPIYEPGLDEVVKEARGRNLFFSTDIPSAIREAEIIFISVNTPTKQSGLGAGMAPDLKYWERCARGVRKYAGGDKIVVEKSTVPVQTAEAMENILNCSSEHHFEVVSNPEFLAEGTAVKDLLEPNRVLIGHRSTPEGVAAAEAVADIYRNWVPHERILMMNTWSSELAKLAANAFLAQRVSSINALSALCEKTGADIEEVAMAVGMDERIGNRFLKASPGFGGSCFKKDILSLVYICKHHGLEEAADYWLEVVKMNEYQKRRFAAAMVKAMFNTLSGKKIALFGAAFKADTDDIRESATIDVAKKLLEEDARVVVTDPKALDNLRRKAAEEGLPLHAEEDPYLAAEGADAIAIMTEWSKFKRLDYERIYRSMNKPAFVFDGRNILDHHRLYEIGFEVYPLGKPPLSHRGCS